MGKIIEKLGLDLVLLALLIVGVSLQGKDVVVWFSVKPNLVLGILIGAVLLLERDWYFALLVIAALGIEFYPGIGRLTFAMLVAGGVNFWLKKKFLADGVVAISILALAGTFVFYLVVSPGYLLEQTNLFLLEVVYNLGIGALVFGILRYLFDEE